jgi:sulfatase maturation enzyme AslB (radical SAM superfamily)
MEFELSNICNLECTMCNGDFSSLIRKNREGRPPVKVVYDEAFVTQLEEFIPHLQEMKFFGGEPFLIDIYYRIWERAVTINPSIRLTVQTNGTVLNQRVKDICAKGKFHISVSIDSLEKENYEHIRKNANFERVMENMEWFREYCQTNDRFFGISTCAMRQNWHELPEFVTFCNDRQIPVFFHTVTHPRESAFAHMSRTELEGVVSVLEASKIPRETPLQRKNTRQLADTVNYVRKMIQRTHMPVFDNRSINSLNDFRDFLISFIESYDGWSDKIKEKKIVAVTEKLDQIHRSLGNDFPYAFHLQQLNLTGSESVFDLIGQLETMPVSAIVLLAKTVS